MSDMPTPERRTALLAPDIRDRGGRPLPVRAATLHHYSHTEERFAGCVQDAPGESWRDDVKYVHIFVCSVTGASRVFGCEGPNSPGVSSDESEEL